ncbi:MAG: class I SAM-dependent methyltransferase [Chlorobi bacterium]|nr:class I SAM-dependent methyltransferase [Chlorobiota bacterium]
MNNYYSDLLNSNKLQKCYELAPPRVKQFLRAEIEFVLNEIKQTDAVLDLGCGFGRVTAELMKKAGKVVGIDISGESIELARKIIGDEKRCRLHTMDAAELKFPDNSFDVVICVQNGISAFKTDPLQLMKESIRVARKGGTLLFSSYSEKFWEHRLEWFQIQSEHGLIGEIDYEATKNGQVICKDGFKAITYSKKEFLGLASSFDVQTSIYEVDESSLFCKMVVGGKSHT